MGFTDTRSHHAMPTTSLLHSSLSVDLRDHTIDRSSEGATLGGTPPFSLDVSNLSLTGTSQGTSLGSSCSFPEAANTLYPPSSKGSAHPTAGPSTAINNSEPSIKENTGRWTSEEHNIFLEGLKLHGKGWKAIAQMIKTRTVVQIRTHAQKYFQKLAKAQQNGETPEEVLMDTRSSMPIDIPKSNAMPSSQFTGPTKRKKKSAPSKRKPQQAELDGGTTTFPRQTTGSAPKRLAIDVSSHLTSAVGSPSPSSIIDVDMSNTFSEGPDWLQRVSQPDNGMDSFLPDTIEWFPRTESSTTSELSSNMSDYSDTEKEDQMFSQGLSLFSSDAHSFMPEMEPSLDLGDHSVFDVSLDEDAFVSALLADDCTGGVW